jgi:hypothetical protein
VRGCGVLILGPLRERRIGGGLNSERRGTILRDSRK